MRVVVFAAGQGPDPARRRAVELRVGPLMGEGGPLLGPADLRALEAGVDVAESTEGSEVVLVSMGPRPAVDGLRTGLAMGAARAVLVRDNALADADALGTAKVLAAVVRRVRPELVVAGSASTDGSLSVIPAQVAELLGWPAVTAARSLAVAAEFVRAERPTASGVEDVESRLPCVVSLSSGAREPRYPSLRAIVDARDKPVEVISVRDLGLAGDEVRFSARARRVVEVAARPRRRVAGEVVADDGQSAERIVDFLAGLGAV